MITHNTQPTTHNPCAIIAYIPVLHQGYLQFFARHREAKTLYLLGSDFLLQHRNIEKDLRALSPEQMKKIIESLQLFDHVEVIDVSSIIPHSSSMVVMPDEELSHEIVKKYLQDQKVEFDSIFLRWDAARSTKPMSVEHDAVVTVEKFHQEMINKASELSEKSLDWWRQVGAVLVKDGKMVFSAVNMHVPHEQQPYVDGDPRADFHKGDHIELGTAIHAEPQVIAYCAKKGIAIDGADLYVTTYPCPVCAKLIAESGIKRLFFQDGYAMLDGERVLKAKGVEIIKVQEE